MSEMSAREVHAYVWCEMVLPHRLMRRLCRRLVEVEQVSRHVERGEWSEDCVWLLVGMVLFPLTGEQVEQVNGERLLARVRMVAGSAVAEQVRTVVKGEADSVLVQQAWGEVVGRFFQWAQASIEND